MRRMVRYVGNAFSSDPNGDGPYVSHYSYSITCDGNTLICDISPELHFSYVSTGRFPVPVVWNMMTSAIDADLPLHIEYCQVEVPAWQYWLGRAVYTIGVYGLYSLCMLGIYYVKGVKWALLTTALTCRSLPSAPTLSYVEEVDRPLLAGKEYSSDIAGDGPGVRQLIQVININLAIARLMLKFAKLAVIGIGKLTPLDLFRLRKTPCKHIFFECAALGEGQYVDKSYVKIDDVVHIAEGVPVEYEFEYVTYFGNEYSSDVSGDGPSAGHRVQTIRCEVERDPLFKLRFSRDNWQRILFNGIGTKVYRPLVFSDFLQSGTNLEGNISPGFVQIGTEVIDASTTTDEEHVRGRLWMWFVEDLPYQDFEQTCDPCVEEIFKCLSIINRFEEQPVYGGCQVCDRTFDGFTVCYTCRKVVCGECYVKICTRPNPRCPFCRETWDHNLVTKVRQNVQFLRSGSRADWFEYFFSIIGAVGVPITREGVALLRNQIGFSRPEALLDYRDKNTLYHYMNKVEEARRASRQAVDTLRSIDCGAESVHVGNGWRALFKISNDISTRVLMENNFDIYDRSVIKAILDKL
jgi:hypothetical protein